VCPGRMPLGAVAVAGRGSCLDGRCGWWRRPKGQHPGPGRSQQMQPRTDHCHNVHYRHIAIARRYVSGAPVKAGSSFAAGVYFACPGSPHGGDEPVLATRPGATQASDALVAMQKLVGEAIAAGADAVDPAALDEQVWRYRSAAQIGATSTADRSNPVMRKHHALARRLLDRHDDYLRFTRDWRIPPDNNGSERDIRMIKLRQKISGCLRTVTGARQFCAIRSYLSTATKHGKHFFEVLVMLAEGRPWLPATH
jgi:hypothetical protein